MGITLSGLPSDRFLFAGFLPSKEKARGDVLGELASVPATLVFYETSPRLIDRWRRLPRFCPVARWRWRAS
jgi:16S rRNA (cytidine1402-2'-O)-methyltransferase